MSDDKTETISSSFAIVIEPEFEEGKWSGSVACHVEEDVREDLEQESVEQIRSVVGMMASTLTLMEDDAEFLEHVKAYFLANYQHLISEFIESKVEDKPSFVRSKEGNVITLDFNTKTHGNA